MGLSIYYNGKFNPSASLGEMIEEVKDIAEINKWEYHIFENEFPKTTLGKAGFNSKIYGICFTPPECETVDIAFLSNGRMSCAANLQFYGKAVKGPEKDYLYMLSVKTQYAGIEIHKQVIHIFKYLAPKYFLSFEMKDEGKYWETGDEKLLHEIFKKYDALISRFTSGLEHIPINPGESFLAYLLRIAKRVQ